MTPASSRDGHSDGLVARSESPMSSSSPAPVDRREHGIGGAKAPSTEPKRSSTRRRARDWDLRQSNPVPRGVVILPVWYEVMCERMDRTRFSELAELWDRLSDIDRAKLIELIARIVPRVEHRKPDRGPQSRKLEPRPPP